MAKPAKHDPLDLPLCTCATLRRASRAVTQAYEEALQPVDLTPTQFTTLAALQTLGPTPLSQLADSLGTDRTTLNRNLKPLLRRDLVASAAGEDQRQRVIRLTSDGERTLVSAIPLWRAMQERMVSAMGQETWSHLIDHVALAAKSAHSP